MIKIVKEKQPKSKSTPYYSLTYKYMIGDANGETSETVIVSKDNPFLERYVKLLRSLKPTHDSWGIVFEQHRLANFLDEKQITEEDYYFLQRMMFEEYDEDDEDSEIAKRFIVSKDDEKYADQFSQGVCGQTEYSFLVFEGIELMYIDEYKKKHKAIVK